MTAQQKINSLEKKVATLEAQLAHIVQRFGLAPDEKELDRALDQLIHNRDKSALDAYLRRGGKIPQIEGMDA